MWEKMQTKKLTDICDIKYGYAFDSKCFTENSMFPSLVRIRDVKRGFSETYYSGDYPSEYLISKGDLLIGMDGEFNIARWKSDNALLNQRVCKIIAKHGTDEEYLRFAMTIALKEIERKTSFVTVKHLSAKELNKLYLKIPEFDEQKKISNILTKIESIIEVYYKEVVLLNELIKARFVEMFGNPITNSKNLEAEKLKDVLILKAGDFTAASDISIERTPTNPYPCYGGNGIRGYVAEYNQDGDYSLIGRQGALSGNVQFARGRFKNTEHALLVKSKIEMDGMWLNQLLIHLDLKRYQTGAAQPGLSVKNLQEIPIILPPLEFQKQFADFVREVDKSRYVSGFYKYIKHK